MGKIDYDADAARLVSLIGKGKKNAVKRSDLLELFGGTDRQMRKVISYARLKGQRINNDQDGKGYYLPDDLDELVRQYAQMNRRAKTILAQMTALRREIESRGIPGQAALQECYFDYE